MEGGRRYRVLEALGRGGFGTVYRAELQGEGGFSKLVALKVLNADVVGTEDIVARLRDEARMLGMLRHRAIVQVDGLVRLDGRWAVVMEYVEGASLNQVLGARQRIEPKMALELAAEVASALHVAFARPASDGRPLALLHRDIKPANIQLTREGEVKLLDFGIARVERKDRGAKTQSAVYGSLPYMAPERFEFEDAHESDVYSLAATLLELMTGDTPEQASANPKKHEERRRNALAKLSTVAANPGLLALVGEGLAYEAKDRPDAKTFERRCIDLAAQLPGGRLQDWAEQVVPPIVAARSLAGDELTDHVLSESVALDAGPHPGPLEPRTDRRPAEPPKAEPSPEPSPPPSSGSTGSSSSSPSGSGVLWRLFQSFVVITGASTVLSVVFVAGFFLLCCGGCLGIVAYAPVDDSTIDRIAQEARAGAPDDPNLPKLLALIDRAHVDRSTGKLTIWRLTTFETGVQHAVADGTITDGELAGLQADYDAMLQG